MGMCVWNRSEDGGTLWGWGSNEHGTTAYPAFKLLTS